MGQAQKIKNEIVNTVTVQGAVKTLPTCVLLAGDYPTFAKKLSEELHEQGIYLETVSSLDEVIALEQKPEVFCVLVNLSQYSDVPALFKSRSPKAKSFWVALSTKITGQSGATLLSQGFSELLPWPSHPSSVKGRTRMLLSKYVKKFSMPETVHLPSGIQRPADISISNSSYSEDEPRGAVISVGATKKESSVPDFGSKLVAETTPYPKGQSTFSPDIYKKFSLSESEWKELEKQMAPLPELFNLTRKQTTKSLRFTEAAKTLGTCVVWTEGRGVSATFSVKKYVAGKGLLHISYPADLSREKIVRKLKAEGSEYLYLNLRMQGSSLLLRQSVGKIVFSADGIFVDTNSDLFEVQRRQNFRAQRSKKMKLDVQVLAKVNGRDHDLNIPVKDVSAGGVCLYAPRMLFEGLQTKICTIAEVNLQLGSQKFQFQAAPRWQTELKNGAGKSYYLVGLEFLDVKPEIRQKLQETVLDASIDYLKKFRLESLSEV